MKVARRAVVIVALVATSLSPAFGAAHHRTADRPYGHVPRITIYPAHREYRPYIDYSRYIDPLNGMYCVNTGWAATCVPPRNVGYYGVNCTAGWPFASCTRF
jgi:hypothetical protein